MYNRIVSNRYRLLIFIVTFTVIACQPDIREQEALRSEGLKKITRFIGKYPSFQNVLTEIKNEGNVIWEEAQKIRDVQKKYEHMKKSNDLINGTLCRNLDEFGERIAKIKNHRREIKKLKTNAFPPEQIENELIESRNEMWRAAEMLNNAKVETREDAEIISEEALEIVRHVDLDVERFLKSILSKQKVMESK